MLRERGLISDVVQTACDQDSQGFPYGLGSMEYDCESSLVSGTFLMD